MGHVTTGSRCEENLTCLPMAGLNSAHLVGAEIQGFSCVLSEEDLWHCECLGEQLKHHGLRAC